MRYWCKLLAVIMACLLLATGCTRAVAGVAQPDPRKPGTALSEDGYGIITGFPDAPVRVDIFTEPQCNHCADLQKDFGPDIARYINAGRLVVTYRPMTFLDTTPGGYSARVSNALFLAAGSDTSAETFQAFVQDLYRHQDPGGEGPDDREIAEMAHDSGAPSAVVDRIAAGKSALDVAQMADANFEYLFEANPLDPGTPTVYNLEDDEILDIYDNDWLDKLMASA